MILIFVQCTGIWKFYKSHMFTCFCKSGTEDRERPGEGIGCIGSAEKEFRDPHLENTELV